MALLCNRVYNCILGAFACSVLKGVYAGAIMLYIY